jgi:hypothetical protein
MPAVPYASTTEVYAESGLTTDDVSSGDMSTFITEAMNHIREDAYFLVREEQVVGTTLSSGVVRYYPRANSGVSRYSGVSLPPAGGVYRIYFADDNLDGALTVADIQVYEFDSQQDYDISSQVDTISDREGYFTLKAGYPSNGRSVKVTYRFAQKPFSEIVNTLLKRATIAYATYLAMKQMRIKIVKSGLSNINAPEQTVTIDTSHFDESSEAALNKYYHYIFQIKPIYMRGWAGGRTEDLPSMFGRFRGYY